MFYNMGCYEHDHTCYTLTNTCALYTYVPYIYISTCEQAQDGKVGPTSNLNLMFFYLILFRDARV